MSKSEGTELGKIQRQHLKPSVWMWGNSGFKVSQTTGWSSIWWGRRLKKDEFFMFLTWEGSSVTNFFSHTDSLQPTAPCLSGAYPPANVLLLSPSSFCPSCPSSFWSLSCYSLSPSPTPPSGRLTQDIVEIFFPHIPHWAFSIFSK